MASTHPLNKEFNTDLKEWKEKIKYAILLLISQAYAYGRIVADNTFRSSPCQNNIVKQTQHVRQF